MSLDVAIEKVVASLKEESCVQSIFLKGSIGRNEHDDHSDIDLYCLVDEKEMESFLSRRMEHIKAYRDVIFYDDIFIIAPQTIAIYDDWLHIDLFTVTEKTFKEKDFFKVLYDPKGVMRKFESSQNLTLSDKEFRDHVLDTAWFLYQYKKASERGNNTWATEMLRHVMRDTSNLLLYHYEKDRSTLGLKAIHNHLPEELQNEIVAIYEELTPSLHQNAVKKIAVLLNQEYHWIAEQLGEDNQMKTFLKRMVENFLKKNREVLLLPKRKQ